jgi:hypothetical protein
MSVTGGMIGLRSSLLNAMQLSTETGFCPGDWRLAMPPKAENLSLCGPSCVLTTRMSWISRGHSERQKTCNIN